MKYEISASKRGENIFNNLKWLRENTLSTEQLARGCANNKKTQKLMYPNSKSSSVSISFNNYSLSGSQLCWNILCIYHKCFSITLFHDFVCCNRAFIKTFKSIGLWFMNHDYYFSLSFVCDFTRKSVYLFTRTILSWQIIIQ